MNNYVGLEPLIEGIDNSSVLAVKVCLFIYFYTS